MTGMPLCFAVCLTELMFHVYSENRFLPTLLNESINLTAFIRVTIVSASLLALTKGPLWVSKLGINFFLDL